MLASVASSGWTPSVLRTVDPIPSAAAVARGIGAPSVVSWPTKAPLEILDYTLDLDIWRGDGDDTLVGATASVSPQAQSTDLGIVWLSIIDGNPTLLLGGGTAGITYNVLIEIKTTAGRQAVFLVALLISPVTPSVAPPAPEPAAPNTLTTDAGILTLDGGSPLLLA